MPANDLSFDLLPDWLREAGLTRLNAYMGEHGKSPDWRFLGHLAVDESGLKVTHRSVLRTLLTIKPGSSWALAEIGRRSGVSESNMVRVTRDLEEWGWLFLNRVKGGRTGHKWTVAVPVDYPPDRTISPAKSAAATRRHRDLTLASCNPQPLQLAEQPLQVANPAPASCNPRNQRGPLEPLGGRTNAAPDSARRNITPDARWLHIVKRIDQHKIRAWMPDGAKRRQFADYLVAHHGLGVELDTVDLILHDVCRRLNDGPINLKPDTALAQSMDVPLADLKAMRRDYLESRRAS